VVQTYGGQVTANGTPLAAPSASPGQPAAMPGGVTGGGHFLRPGQGQHRTAGTTLGLGAWGCVGALTVMVGAALVRRRSGRRPRRTVKAGRHRRGATTTADPPSDDNPEGERPLALSGKGDRA